jgi:hypothetical protein
MFVHFNVCATLQLKMQTVSDIFAVKYSCCWYNVALVTSDAYYPQCIGVFHVPLVTNQMTNNLMHVTFVVCGPQLFDCSRFRRVRISAENLLQLLCPAALSPVCTIVTSREQLNDFSLHILIEVATKYCGGFRISISIGKS